MLLFSKDVRTDFSKRAFAGTVRAIRGARVVASNIFPYF
ncbi:hypothetical protein BRPE64_BCDS03790 [Caballeronia insecticola]|uniref:Uncharacterized protein n=1 Tax=Caballeronia insecticola TaxID=758793 RepID=R4WVI4_9BURK|nr:hypothetical protein BRPE64_BCDS03790 [Caballeronia insecticola]